MVVCTYHILISKNISTNFNVFNNLCFYIRFLMFSVSLKMIKIDRNMSES